MAMDPEPLKDAPHLTRRRVVIEASSDDETEEEKTTKEGYYKCGTAFCLLGVTMCQNGAAPAGSTMLLGALLFYQGYTAPATDHFD